MDMPKIVVFIHNIHICMTVDDFKAIDVTGFCYLNLYVKGLNIINKIIQKKVKKTKVLFNE